MYTIFSPGRLRLLLPALVLLLLSACATKAPLPEPTGDEVTRWQAYCSHTSQEKPYRISLSLRLGRKGETRRVTALLWGNSSDRLRLDVMAGVGTTLAKLEASPTDFLLVAPVDHKAYSHTGTNQPRLKLGVPLPLTLSDLADLLNGNDVKVFGQSYTQAMAQSQGLVRYHLQGKLPGSIDLDALGRPVFWEEKKNGGWRMLLERDAQGATRKLDLSNHKGERLLVLVKEREWPASFSHDQLKVTVPGGYPVLPLAKYAEEKTAERP